VKLSTTIASVAVVLGVILAAGYANGEAAAVTESAKQTAQDKVVAREMQRRVAVEEQQKRKDAYERACNKPRTDSEFRRCRAAYKNLEPAK
jgi:hypothetical protein